MYENQFINFQPSISSNCEMPLPVIDNSAIRFVHDYPSESILTLSDLYGNIIPGAIERTITEGDGVFTTLPAGVLQDVPYGKCVRLMAGEKYEASGGSYGGTPEALDTGTRGMYVRTDTHEATFYGVDLSRLFDESIQAPIDINGTFKVFIDIPASFTGSIVAGIANVDGRGRTDTRNYLKEDTNPLTIEVSLPISLAQYPDKMKYFVFANTRPSFRYTPIAGATARTVANYNYTDIRNAQFSNPLMRADNSNGDYAEVSYRCNEDAFGIPFSSGTVLRPNPKMLTVHLPVRTSKPQYNQEDSVYTKSNGEVVTLYAEVNKEYECETDYIPESWHDRLIIALSCDEVFVDGKRMSKSDKYDIKWDETDKTECGVKIARATFKMKENIVQRNTNY